MNNFRQLHVEDCFQNLKFRLIFHHKPMEVDEGGEPVGEMFQLSGEPPKEETKEEAPAEPQADAAMKQEDEDDDDIMAITDHEPMQKSKRVKMDTANEDNVIEIE